MDAQKHSSYDVEATADEEQSISIEQLQHLVQLLDQSNVTEIEVKRPEEGTRLVLRKARLPEVGEHNGFHAIAPAARAEEGALPELEAKATIVAPLVGIFHPWARPKGGAVVAVGDRVKVGQLVGTIQSLNVINEVESTVNGRVVEIFVQDEQAVEYGQSLMLIDCSEEA
ncbi:MAG TPA: biotin/lipoyl-containing protein [Ktedonobacteraceae bacterium]|nr:biotin/lipoyl-containing protein [Ktedonobacteraceae bacterium]